MEFLGLAYLFVPGYIANGVPPLLAHVPGLARLNAPLDGGHAWRGKRLLGANKTWRGAVGATLLAGLAHLGQRWLAENGVLATTPVLQVPWWYGFLLGAGVILIGDAVESFLKRRSGVGPGRLWVPFDQIDYTLGGMLATAWLYWPGWPLFALLLVVNGIGSAVLHYLGYLLGVNKDRF